MILIIDVRTFNLILLYYLEIVTREIKYWFDVRYNMLHINIDGVSESPKLFHIHASGNLIQSKVAAIGRKCQETMNKLSSIWNDNLNDRELSGLFLNTITND